MTKNADQVLILENQWRVLPRLVKDDGEDEVGDGDGPEEDGDDCRENKLLKRAKIT